MSSHLQRFFLAHVFLGILSYFYPIRVADSCYCLLTTSQGCQQSGSLEAAEIKCINENERKKEQFISIHCGITCSIESDKVTCPSPFSVFIQNIKGCKLFPLTPLSRGKKTSRKINLEYKILHNLFLWALVIHFNSIMPH